MGNSASSVEAQDADHTEHSYADVFGEAYKWPENLYREVADMAAASFLVYSFAYILDTARKVGLQGLAVDSTGHATNSAIKTSRLSRSFSPSEVKKIVLDNLSVLAEHYPSEFSDPVRVKLSLEKLEERAKTSGLKRPLTLEEFDDKHQEKELVYGVTVDRANKRITICFRGTENQLASDTNWSANLDAWKVGVPVPESIKDKVVDDEVRFHRGIYNYIFSATASENDAPEKRKYDEIVEDVKPLLKANPGYKLYVTGHSLGAALSSIVAFYLACEDDTVIPKPVTCINFASPRVGNHAYLESSTALESSGKLRFLRIVNDGDSIAMVPMVNYCHAGHQIRLSKDALKEAPEVTYPKLGDDYMSRWSRTWGNSLFTSFNLSYDHSEYRERVEENKAALEKMDLNSLYEDEELTGFELTA